jgi:hypothetical protein
VEQLEFDSEIAAESAAWEEPQFGSFVAVEVEHFQMEVLDQRSQSAEVATAAEAGTVLAGFALGNPYTAAVMELVHTPLGSH